MVLKLQTGTRNKKWHKQKNPSYSDRKSNIQIKKNRLLEDMHCTETGCTPE